VSESRPEVTVIVPVFRGAKVISPCLDKVTGQQTARSIEVIVVDDGSDDHTGAVVTDWIERYRNNSEGTVPVRLIRQEHKGPAAARNLGARHAQGEILLFTDADCEPYPNWLDAMIEPFRDPAICGVKGAYETVQPEWVARLVQVEYEEKYNRMKRFDSIDFIDTYSAAFRRDVFLSLEGFDESFPNASVEDQEFSFRMAEQGCKMCFVPYARVAHRHATNLRTYAKKKFRIAYYKSYLLVRHPGRVRGDTHTPPSLVSQIPLSYLLPIFLAVTVWWQPAVWMAAAALAANLACMGGTFRVCRNRAPRLLPLVPVLLMTRSFALGAGLICGTVRFRARGLKPRANESQYDKSG